MRGEIAAAQQALVDEFALFDDWVDRYQYLIDLGRQLPPFPAALMTEENRIRGCQAQVWFDAHLEDGRLKMQASSDAAIVSGLIAVLLRLYNDRMPQEILDTPPDFVEALDLERHLSPTRSNGLAAMLAAIRQRAELAVS